MSKEKNKGIFYRILEVFIQFSLLPVSAFITLTGGWYFWYLIYCIILGNAFMIILGATIVGILMALFVTPFSLMGVILIDDLKKRDSVPELGDGEVYTYEVEVSHDIKTTDGTVIGTYTTTETKEGTHLTGADIRGILLYILRCLIALPCRIISIFLAIISCFTNKFFVMVRKPRINKKYFAFLHNYFDVVVIKK